VFKNPEPKNMTIKAADLIQSVEWIVFTPEIVTDME
jgi:hypothetical protein